MKKRRILPFVLVLLSLLCWGCGDTPMQNGAEQIGIITSGPIQTNAGLYAAKLEEQHRTGDTPQIIHTYWPDNLTERPEHVRQAISEMLEDPAIGALIMSTISPTLGPILDDTVSLRENKFVIACVSGSDVPEIAAQVDLVLNLDFASMGFIMAEQANLMNAETLVYYYFPLQMHQSNFARQYSLAEQTCANLGIDFIPVELPEGKGLQPGGAEFLSTDIPQKVAEHGLNTAFFANGYEATLISQVIEQRAIYPLPSIPTPYLGYPHALGIEINNDHYGDYEYINSTIEQLSTEKITSGRLANFAIDYEDLVIKTAYEYAAKWLQGEVSKDTVDFLVLEAIMEELSGTKCYLRMFEENDVEYENYVLYTLEPYIIY